MKNALIEKHFNNAKLSFTNDEIAKAIDSIEKVLHIDKDNIDAFFFRGKCYKKLNNLKKALDDFLKTVLDKNCCIKGGLALRICIRKMGYQKETEEIIKGWVKKHPENEQILIIYGEYLFNKGDYLKAMDEFKKSIRFGTDSLNQSYGYISKCWEKLDNFDKAIENLNLAIKNSINEDICKTLLYYDRAKLFFSKNEYDSACIDAIRALKFHEENPILDESKCNNLYKYINTYNQIKKTQILPVLNTIQLIDSI